MQTLPINGKRTAMVLFFFALWAMQVFWSTRLLGKRNVCFPTGL